MLNIIEFPSNMFSFDGNTFVAEASDLGNRHLQPLYENQDEVGFAIKNEQTGVVIKYALCRVVKDDEGDILYWFYTPCHEDVRLHPEVTFTNARIFND